MGDDLEAGVHAQFQQLIQQGLGLQGAFDSEQAIEPRHITLIRSWMNQALGLIEPAMPPGDTQLDALTEIGRAYSNAVSVLPGNTSEHVRIVCAALKRAYEYFCTWDKRDFSQIDPAARAEACHGALVETWCFSRNSLSGLLAGKEDGLTKRTALLHSYGRMYCWVHSMVKLGNDSNGRALIAEHTLALAACLRAIFELFLDISLLGADKIKDGPEKFFSFEKVARRRIANSSLLLDREYKHLSEEQRSTFENAAADKKGEIDNCIKRLWGVIKRGKNKGEPTRPDHWTGMNVIDRVKRLGGDYIRYYQHSYHYCNWSLHSGYDGFLMKTEENASLFSALIYAFANGMFLHATEMMMEEFTEVLDGSTLKKQLTKVELRGAHILWDAAVKAEKSR